MIIYKITNQINQKNYIGQTIRTLNERWSEHIKCAENNDRRHLYCAMRHYGTDNFIIEQLDIANSIEELNILEQKYIRLYDSYRNGYNMTDGGEYNPMHCTKSKQSHDIKMRSPEVRKQISESMKIHFKENPVSEITKSKLSNYRKQRCFVHKDNVVIQILKTDLDTYLAEGWIKGNKACDPNVVKIRAAKRSINVQCIDENNYIIKTFNSVKSAAQWWYNYNYSDITNPLYLMNLIKKSSSKDIYIKGLKWIYLK